MRKILKTFMAVSALVISGEVIGQDLDILIKGAKVYDGTNSPGKVKDVGVRDGQIVFVGKAKAGFAASREIEAEGMILAPGFIDPHTHVEGDLSHPDRRSNLAYLMQGVTTVIGGNDGSGPFPIGEKLDEWEKNGIGTNAGLFVGHGTVRRLVLGNKDVAPDENQLEEMKSLVAKGMEEGALGLSTGLFYSPGSFAEKSEVVALAKVAHQHGGIYDTHMRDESSYSIGLLSSVEETLEIGRESGIPIHFSHLKALGADVWGMSDEVIRKIEEAQDAGMEVTANQYPYEASRTSLIAAVVPRWAEDGGYEALLERLQDPNLLDTLSEGMTENIRRRGGPSSLILSDSKMPEIDGKSLEKMAAEWQMEPWEAVFKILKESSAVRVVSFNMQEEDIVNFMRQPWMMTGSDGVVAHPRKYGSFTKKLVEYTLEKNVIPLEFAIHSSSGLTAETLGIKDRGFVKEGYYADLILFRLDELENNADYDNPSALSGGMQYVMVNGKLAIDEGEYTGELAGKAIKK
ncbi:D-aminoacylase [Litoribacter ruber]|uniref:D-aminoacylase n=1 Tax=Litoribacter ruber TaxID=702568 RepID=A0AAP2G5H8_9BACT|nr:MULTISPECIES: D-aminoacylase [Litoribacter]MBS9524558.1 D-aminoacylase [Litoribacter alkaliphilus]MBT0810282.1 D-aminoacylase [Litoribacter ruber]